MKRTLLFSGLFGLSALMLPARSPSGFDDGVDVWFRTAPVSSNLQGRYLWFDFAGDSLSLYAYNRTAGTYVFTQDKSLLKFLNFNPAIDFSKGDSPKWGDLLRSNLTQATIIGVFAPYSFTDESVIYGVASGDGGGSLVTNDKIVRPGSVAPLDYGDTEGYQDYKAGNRKSIPDHYRVDFGPFGETGPIQGMWNDGGYNSASQFIGTATYYFQLDKNDVLNIRVEDSKTEYSLFYHAPFTDRHSRNEKRILGETFQKYKFSIPLNEVKKRVSE